MFNFRCIADSNNGWEQHLKTLENTRNHQMSLKDYPEWLWFTLHTTTSSTPHFNIYVNRFLFSEKCLQNSYYFNLSFRRQLFRTFLFILLVYSTLVYLLSNHSHSKPQHSLLLVLIIPLVILIILLVILIIHIPKSRSNPHYYHSYPHQSLILTLIKSPISYCTLLTCATYITLCSYSHVPLSTFFTHNYPCYQW